MSDVSSVVTYTSVYIDSEPLRYYGGSKDEAGSPRVIVLGYDRLPMQQPPPADASPIALSPEYVADSDLEEDPKEDLEEDHVDYPADRGDGDDDPSNDDDDDDTDDGDEEDQDNDEEEEHLAPADSSDVPIVDHTVILDPPMSASMEACIARHAALLSPQLPVPSQPLSLPLPSLLITSPTNAGAQLGYWAARIRMRALRPATSRMTDIPEADMPPRKRACDIC
nr:hypothetical protein [Tanacetum cinerariifolium]